MDDASMRQLEGVSKEEDKITLKRSEGRELKKVERVQNAPELVVARAQMKVKEDGAEKCWRKFRVDKK